MNKDAGNFSAGPALKDTGLLITQPLLLEATSSAWLRFSADQAAAFLPQPSFPLFFHKCQTYTVLLPLHPKCFPNTFFTRLILSWCLN